jgi:hypothetical protein
MSGTGTGADAGRSEPHKKPALTHVTILEWLEVKKYKPEEFFVFASNFVRAVEARCGEIPDSFLPICSFGFSLEALDSFVDLQHTNQLLRDILSGELEEERFSRREHARSIVYSLYKSGELKRYWDSQVHSERQKIALLEARLEKKKQRLQDIVGKPEEKRPRLRIKERNTSSESDDAKPRADPTKSDI